MIKPQFNHDSFTYSKKAFDNFADKYNANKDKLQDHIRAAHRDLFYDLLRMYKKVVSDKRKLFPDEKDLLGLPIFTNRHQLAVRLSKSKESIGRHLKFLEEIEVISRISHGSKSNQEIRINADFLLAFVEDNPQKKSQKHDFSQSADNQYNFLFKLAICQNKQNKTRNYNNIIMNVDKEFDNSQAHHQTNDTKEPKSLQQILKPELNATRNDKKNDKKLDKKPPNIKCYKKKELDFHSKEHAYRDKLATKQEKIRKLKKNFSAWLLSLAVEKLWKDRNVYAGEYQKTLDYLEKNYWEHCNTYKSINKTMDEFKWRIEAAARYIERQKDKNPDFQMNVFPYQYFNLNNKSGLSFRGTKKWFIDGYQWNKIKRKQKKIKKDRDKLMQVIRKYNDNPRYDSFLHLQDYVQKNIPHLHNSFLTAIANQNEVSNTLAEA